MAVCLFTWKNNNGNPNFSIIIKTGFTPKISAAFSQGYYNTPSSINALQSCHFLSILNTSWTFPQCLINMFVLISKIIVNYYASEFWVNSFFCFVFVLIFVNSCQLLWVRTDDSLEYMSNWRLRLNGAKVGWKWFAYNANQIICILRLTTVLLDIRGPI